MCPIFPIVLILVRVLFFAYVGKDLRTVIKNMREDFAELQKKKDEL